MGRDLPIGRLHVAARCATSPAAEYTSGASTSSEVALSKLPWVCLLSCDGQPALKLRRRSTIRPRRPEVKGARPRLLPHAWHY